MPRLMVVDDDPDIRAALATCLDREGFEVDLCADGQEAIERLARDERPHTIILDLMMPRMNGFEVLEALKAQGSQIPVVVISANRGYTAQDLGVTSLMRKPFDLEELIDVLRRVA
jgi:CheY-like chemotaxis protein